MKRIKLFLILLLILPVLVKADAGPPDVTNYVVTVSNKSGAQCYNQKDGKVVKTTRVHKYNTKLIVFQDVSKDYVYVRLPGSESYETDCMVKVSDITIGNKEFSSSDIYEFETVQTIILFDDVAIYKGPSFGYPKTNVVIPKGTILKYKYESSYWIYVNYKGTTGWINSNESPYYINGEGYTFGYDDDSILFTIEDAELKDDKGKVVGTIPEGIEITNYVSRGRFREAYVYYNGKEGFIDDSSYTYKMNIEITLIKDAPVYEESGKKVDTLPAGTVVKSNYYFSEFSITKIYLSDKKAYLILGNGDDEADMDYYDSDKAVFADHEVKKTGYIKDMFNLTGVADAPIPPKNTEKPVTEPTEVEPQEPTEEPPVTEPSEEPGEVIPVEPEDEPNEIPNKNANDKPVTTNNNQIIIYGVLGGIILFLVAIIILLLINKNNKKENVKVQEEPKVEEQKEEVDENKEINENNKETDHE